MLVASINPNTYAPVAQPYGPTVGAPLVTKKLSMGHVVEHFFTGDIRARIALNASSSTATTTMPPPQVFWFRVDKGWGVVMS